MTSRWAVPLSMLASVGLAIAVVALVLGREELPTATYLVYTSEEQPLPRGGVVETPHGENVWLRFEVVEDAAHIGPRLTEAQGLVLDAGAYRALAPVLLREWRFDGVVLAVYGVDPAETATGLEIDRSEAPRSGAINSFVLLRGTDALIGDPSTIDRTRPFVGVTYRPPTVVEMNLGTLGWFQVGDDSLRPWLARLAETSRLAYMAAD